MSTELVNGGPVSPTTTSPPAVPPPEVEAAISRLSGYRNVRGVMVLARGGSASTGGILQSSGAVFDGDSGKRYAGALEFVVNATAGAVDACDEGVCDKGYGIGADIQDELKLLRIRTKRHELIITPRTSSYVLADSR